MNPDKNQLYGGNSMFGLDDLVGGAIGAVGNLISGHSNAKQAERLYKHRYQWEVGDLRKAGLNPALAYGHNAPTPQTQPLEPLGDSFTKGAQASAQRGQANAARQLTEAQTNLLRAQTADLIEGTKLKNQLTRANIDYTGSRTGLTKEQIGLTGLQKGNTAASTAEILARTDHIRQQIQESKARVNLITEQTQLTRAEAEKAYVIMASMQLDMRWTRATWDVKLDLLQTELKQAGINIQLARLDKLAKELGLPELRGEAAWFRELGAMGTKDAQQVIRAILMYAKRSN